MEECRVLVIDECKLTNGIIEAIGECYGIKYDHSNWEEESYLEHIEYVVGMLQEKIEI